MKEYSATAHIAASPERIWSVLSMVDRWPDWTPTVTRIEPQSTDTFTVGSMMKIYQPKLRPALWVITSWEPNMAFAWVSRSPGVLVTAEHIITLSIGFEF
jgi:hypothetical protein